MLEKHELGICRVKQCHCHKTQNEHVGRKKVCHAKRLGLRQEERTHSGSNGQTNQY